MTKQITGEQIDKILNTLYQEKISAPLFDIVVKFFRELPETEVINKPDSVEDIKK